MFSQAVQIANVSKTEFIDANNTPATVKWYCWVVAYNSAGAGAVSEAVEATIAAI